ncbi:bifunctional lysylphosphatidylglycerol flippase/synthetase MprF [Stakelama tenebrarum]|uniref:Bifunctional lysylphosphatidylglycerol flippase/synthetase MprF n=1 Tax=Stakelama tenebrarum TaxID=2711215 RepID=A0A6G6Y8A9_9SPHN|nr:bifunctional lysylphosphatidylglycerol flippase/synthetase MprF [Sphingosinithalassobacter tenebrarum]QIG81037.1 bifunctional lysylphosphatidylglycerol flippase/synthetase MprF [Sphingosinithalassobacter tenebrarum]
MNFEDPSFEPQGSGVAARALRWCAARRDWIVTIAGIAILALAFVALSAVLRDIRAADIQQAFATVPLGRWLTALGFTAASFACLIYFDFAAFRTIGQKVRSGVVARAAATSYGISNTLGLPVLTGGTVRLNFYAKEGVSEADIARVVTIAGLTFWLGILVVVGLTLPLQPGGVHLGPIALPHVVRWGVPLLLVAALATYLWWTARAPRTVAFSGISIPLPGPALTLGQLAAAALDLIFSAAVIFVLLPELGVSAFPQLLAAFVLALAIAVITHAPGGLGVFEATVLILLPNIPRDSLAAALIGYRLIYFLLPFALALVYLAIREGESLHARAAPVVRAGGAVARSLAPLTMAAAVFAAGALLILSGAFPLYPERIAVITALLPETLLELSHFTSSIIGALLLFTAYGLYRRLDIAWLTSMVLIGAGMVLAVLRAFDIVEALVLGGIFALLAWTRPAFYRQSALTSERPGAGWLVSIVAVIAGSLFIGFFSYKNVEYETALWWSTQPFGDAPRFLRASLGVALVAILLAIRRLTGPARASYDTLPRELPAAVWRKALAASTSSEAHLARTGDKNFLIAEAGDAFLMYRVRGRSFIAMGGPIGEPARAQELAWKFRELADRHGARTVFYRCDAAMLPHLIDLGLGVMKIGEEARIPLDAFTLAGSARAKLRNSVRRCEKEGVTFRVVEGADLMGLLPQLREVSDQWLAAKKQREKQFSLGRFDADYLLGGPVAVAERAGEVLAFVNLWTLPGREEVSFDLMRHRDKVPYGTMDALIVHLAQWAQEAGYRHLALGVAPLSGIENRRLAPLWARIAGLLFQHGERLYGYAGLRKWKEKFGPEWQGRYFAAPRGPRLTIALADTALLVSAPSGDRLSRPIRGPQLLFAQTRPRTAIPERAPLRPARD